MTFINHHRNKKPYKKPEIQQLILDRHLSLSMISYPPGDPDGDDEWPPIWPPPSPSGNNPSGNSPVYGDDLYKVDNPFGNSTPNY